MPKLIELFDGKGNWNRLSSEKVTKHEEMGKPVGLGVDAVSVVTLKDYTVEYINKESDVILHFYSRKTWPDAFIDNVKEAISDSGDTCECEFIMELGSWYIRVFNYSIRRFGAKADASYISSLLQNV